MCRGRGERHLPPSVQEARETAEGSEALVMTNKSRTKGERAPSFQIAVRKAVVGN